MNALLSPATATKFSSVFELGEESDSYLVEPKDPDEEVGTVLVLGGAVVEIAVRTRDRYANQRELDWIDNLMENLTEWRTALVEPAQELTTVDGQS